MCDISVMVITTYVCKKFAFVNGMWKTLAQLETFKLISRPSPIETLAPLKNFGFGSGSVLSIFSAFQF